MSNLAEKLDNLANSLEAKGMLIEAMEIDVIANTLEAFEKEAWTAKSSKQGSFLIAALDAIKKGNIFEALTQLKLGNGSKEVLLKNYPKDYNVKGFYDSWEKAQYQLEQKDVEGAVTSLNTSMNFLIAAEPTVNAAQRSGVIPAQQSLIFPAKGIDPRAILTKRTPLMPPARAMRSE